MNMEFIKRLANNLFGVKRMMRKNWVSFILKFGIAGKMKAIIGSRP